MAPFDRLHTSSHSPSIATGAILYRLRDSDLLVENREIFFISHLAVFSATPTRDDPVGI